MKKRRIVFLFSVILVLSMLITACGANTGMDTGRQNNEPQTSGQTGTTSGTTSPRNVGNVILDPNVNDAGVLPVVKERIKLTIMQPHHRSPISYDDNAFTHWITEQTNVELEFELLAANEARQKVNILIASGSELPDILNNIGFPDLDVYRYGQQGVLISLNDYYEHYGHWSKIMFENAGFPYVKDFITSADGKIYVLPRVTEQLGNEWSQRAWINQTWLDNLGLDMPRTTDEFYNVLKAFKTQDPNRNQKADELPLIGSHNGWRQRPYDYIFNAFIYNDINDRYTVKNGKLGFAYTTDEWRNALKYMNKLASEGLYSPLSFTQDRDQLTQICIAPGEPVVGVLVAGGITATMIGATDDVLAQYVPLPPLVGPEAKQYATYFPAMPSNMAHITKYCKHPLAAFRVLEFLYSEESAYRGRFGIPEKDWFRPEPGQVSTYELLGFEGMPASLISVLEWGSQQRSHWHENNPSWRPYSVSDGQVWDGNPVHGEMFVAKSVLEYMGKAPNEIVYKLIFTLDEAEEIGEIRNTINTFVEESIARFITGDRNIDSEWNSYLNELERMDIKRYLEISQKAYDRMNSR